MRFCQSFMTELYRHLGEYTDVPAGDIGVGGREIGYLFGQYKRITNRYESGVLTGKGLDLGRLAGAHGGHRLRHGVLRRRDAAGARATPSTARRVVVSGSGNVAIYAIEKVHQLGGTVVACSDSGGYVVDEAGIDLELLKEIKDASAGESPTTPSAASARSIRRGRHRSGTSPATSRSPAPRRTSSTATTPRPLVSERLLARRRGREHAHHPGGDPRLREAGVPFGPGKAANAGGVATSALEMQQNAIARLLDLRVHRGATRRDHAPIHDRCLETADEYGAPGRLRGRGEHRRLHPGRRRDARSRTHLSERHGCGQYRRGDR